MTTFDEREQAFEAKFAHDEEMQFNAEARCNKLLGLWAAGLLGLSGSDAEAFARTIVAADLEEAGHEDVVRKLEKELHGRTSAEDIRMKRAELLPQAKAQILTEAG
ncbi:DUF1476 domain-containing protein [Leisingera daeponensis]|uniref:DUF1476 domain-containing protein n=1 Tax=Leisingera daeponensis TaxID=405746 RepID=A0ABS7NA83_9RHOB|nr:DUF1476 domain-containing protein [Leisingera daeponensis]MBY6055111.1 DUF1476 domain-containing protein [Leisingera daeponensis]MBY6138106.1 DUF1476 domain-containing protein [Leisingera daeponensis]